MPRLPRFWFLLPGAALLHLEGMWPSCLWVFQGCRLLWGLFFIVRSCPVCFNSSSTERAVRGERDRRKEGRWASPGKRRRGFGDERLRGFPLRRPVSELSGLGELICALSQGRALGSAWSFQFIFHFHITLLGTAWRLTYYLQRMKGFRVNRV